MTIQPTPYEILRAIQDQQRATDRLVSILIGMLDKSGPDPVLASASQIAAPQDGVRYVPPTQRDRRTVGESARPAVILTVEGVEVRTTERRARLIETVRAASLTLTELARTSIAPTVAGVKAQIIDANNDLQRSGSHLRIRATAGGQRVGARGGRNPSTYRLVGSNASPELTPAAQSEEAAGASPEQAADESAVGGGESLSAQSAEFVTQAGEGEEACTSSDPTPAADGRESLPADAGHGTGECAPRPVGEGVETAIPAPELVKPSEVWSGGGYSVDPEAQKDSVDRTGRRNAGVGQGGAVADAEHTPETAADTNQQLRSVSPPRAAEASPPAGIKRPLAAQPAAAPVKLSRETLKPPPARDRKLRIEPGDLIAVDVKLKEITSRKGVYQVAGANLARALERLKGGQMFGLDLIAKVAGWPSPDVAKTALGFERNRLAEHGLDLWMDKFNVRLREAA